MDAVSRNSKFSRHSHPPQQRVEIPGAVSFALFNGGTITRASVPEKWKYLKKTPRPEEVEEENPAQEKELSFVDI